jgi:hypothetical protein
MIDRKQLENVEYFKYSGDIITNDARCICEIKSSFSMAKAVFNKKRIPFTRKLDSNLRKKLVKCYIWSTALNGDKNWTLGTIDQKYFECSEV